MNVLCTPLELEKAASEVISDPTKSFVTHKQKTSFALPGYSGLDNCTINLNINHSNCQ